MVKTFLDRFSDPQKCHALAEAIAGTARTIRRPVTLMEVCGTHTVAIFRSGLKSMLPDNVRLVSGPGCPVCVTPNGYLDRAIALSRMDDVIITTFGDMMKVPGSSSSLEKERAGGRDVRIVYSTLDALAIARENPNKRVILLGVGFETTAPTIAFALKQARSEGLGNFLALTAHKLVPPALNALVQSKDLNLNGFICPGHVSTIIGVRPFEFLAQEFNIPCVIAGFEPLDLFQAVYLLLSQIAEGRAEVANQYSRAVRYDGNHLAREAIEEVFEETDSEWRGIGVIPRSGLRIRVGFRDFDAEDRVEVQVEKTREPKGCLCGLVIRGKKTPGDCTLFGTRCTPQSPIGPCMVSSEGTCQAYYKYGER